MHTAWSAWLYGAILALLVPHLDGVTYSGILIYYYEHLLIMPIGPLLLYRRYGFTMPNIVNQISSYATMCLYQLLMLAPIGRITMVNLNFALCHTSADPSYSLFGYHYFTFMAMFLCVVSAVARWIAWAYVRIIYGKDKYIVKANT